MIEIKMYESASIFINKQSILRKAQQGFIAYNDKTGPKILFKWASTVLYKHEQNE